MRFLTDTRRLVRDWTSWIAILGGAGIVLISIISLIDILLRVLFNSPIEGIADITRYTFAVVIASFYPAGLVLGHNVTVRFLGRALGNRADLWLGVFGSLVTLGIVCLLAWKISAFTLIATRDGLTTLTLELPQAPWWWVVTFIFCLCVPVQLFMFCDQVYQAVTGEPATPADTGPHQ